MYYSVTKGMDYLFNIRPFTTMKMCTTASIFDKVSSKCGQILIEISKKSPKISKISLSGVISPNLVTLLL